MPPRKSNSSSGSTTASRKTSSSISSAFKPTGSKSASSPFTASGKPGSRSASLPKPVLATSATPTSATVARSTSPEKKEERSLSKEEAEEARDLPELDVEDRSYNGIWKVVQKEKLGKVGPIHAVGENRIHHILRTFDLDPAYGPCLGLTRLERWTRAKALGEEPPLEVYEILNTKEGKLNAEYRENCLAGYGL